MAMARLPREAGLWQRGDLGQQLSALKARLHSPGTRLASGNRAPPTFHSCPLAFPPAVDFLPPPGPSRCGPLLTGTQPRPHQGGLWFDGQADSLPHRSHLTCLRYSSSLPTWRASARSSSIRGPRHALSAPADMEPVPGQVGITWPPGSWLLEGGTASYSPLTRHSTLVPPHAR